MKNITSSTSHRVFDRISTRVLRKRSHFPCISLDLICHILKPSAPRSSTERSLTWDSGSTCLPEATRSAYFPHRHHHIVLSSSRSSDHSRPPFQSPCSVKRSIMASVSANYMKYISSSRLSAVQVLTGGPKGRDHGTMF